MGFADILRQVFDSIWSHRLRSCLTMFGIAWGVASLLLLIGLGEGFRSGNQKQLADLGSNVIMMWGGSIPALPNQHQGMRPYKLTLGDYEEIRRSAPHVTAITAILNRQDLKEVSAYSSAGGQVWGVETNFPDIRNLHMAQGRFLDDADLAGKRDVVILGDKSNDLLFPHRLTGGLPTTLGQFITINGRRFEVIGVAAKIGHGNNDGDNQKIYIPLTTMMEAFPLLADKPATTTDADASTSSGSIAPIDTTHDNTPLDAVNTLQYQPSSPDLNETAKAEVHRIIARRHGFAATNKDAFEEWDTIKANRTIGVIFTAMDIFLGGVGIVTLALGAVGIVNIMLVTVSERTREIGLRKALGATNRSVMLQFFVEGLFLTGFSGAIGIGGAAAIMAIIQAAIGDQGVQGFDPPRPRSDVRGDCRRHSHPRRCRRRRLPGTPGRHARTCRGSPPRLSHSPGRHSERREQSRMGLRFCHRLFLLFLRLPAREPAIVRRRDQPHAQRHLRPGHRSHAA